MPPRREQKHEIYPLCVGTAVREIFLGVFHKRCSASMTVAVSAGNLQGGVPVPCNCLVEDAGKLTSSSLGSMEGSERLVGVNRVSPVVHGGPCWSAMVEKVEGRGFMYNGWTVEAPKTVCVFAQHRVSSVWQVHTLVLHLTAFFLLLFSTSEFFHLPFFPLCLSFRCSSLAPRGKRGGIGMAGTWKWMGPMKRRKRSKRWRRRRRRRRGGRGTGSSCRCWRRWCWAGHSAPHWSWRRWQRCATPVRRKKAAAPALDASTRSSLCSCRRGERRGVKTQTGNTRGGTVHGFFRFCSVGQTKHIIWNCYLGVWKRVLTFSNNFLHFIN